MKVEIEIAAPPSLVFAFIMETEKIQSWYPAFLGYILPDGFDISKPTLGVKYKQQYRYGENSVLEYELEMLHYEKDKDIRFKFNECGGNHSSINHYQFLPCEIGTRFVEETKIKYPTFLQQVIFWFQRGKFQRDWKTSLMKLKEVVEKEYNPNNP